MSTYNVLLMLFSFKDGFTHTAFMINGVQKCRSHSLRRVCTCLTLSQGFYVQNALDNTQLTENSQLLGELIFLLAPYALRSLFSTFPPSVSLMDSLQTFSIFTNPCPFLNTLHFFLTAFYALCGWLGETEHLSEPSRSSAKHTHTQTPTSARCTHTIFATSNSQTTPHTPTL